MGNAVGFLSTPYTRLVNEEYKTPSSVQMEQPKSIFNQSGSNYANTDWVNDKPSQRGLNTRTIESCLQNTELYAGRKERCSHWWASCWREVCAETQDSLWLNILISEQLDYIDKASDEKLKSMRNDVLINVWRFSIFVFASYHEHNYKNKRESILNDFSEVEGQLATLTKKLLLIVGPWFFNALDMRNIDHEDFGDLPGISLTGNYSLIPRNLKQYFSEKGCPHLPDFVRELLEINWQKDSVNEVKKILSLSEKEVNRLKRSGASEILPQISAQNETGKSLCKVTGRSGFPRLTGTNTCFIGTGLQLLSLLQPEIDHQLVELLKVEGRDIVRQLLTESRILLKQGQKCYKEKQGRYFRFIELLVEVQRTYDIKTLEKLPCLIDTDIYMEGVKMLCYPSLRNIEQQDVVEFINCFLTNVVKLNESPDCCIIRDCERIGSSDQAVKVESGDWQFILDIPIPENKALSKSLPLQELLDDMLRPKLAMENSMDTERDILKADTSRLKYLFVQPKAQDCFENRQSVGEALRNGIDDVIRVRFIDKNTGITVEKFFEKVAGIYYTEQGSRSIPRAPNLDFSLGGHYQFTDKTEEGWNKYDDENAQKNHDTALNVTERNLSLGNNSLCLFKTTSEEKYIKILRKVTPRQDNPVREVCFREPLEGMPLNEVS